MLAELLVKMRPNHGLFPEMTVIRCETHPGHEYN
jgi:hypothetical protein